MVLWESFATVCLSKLSTCWCLWRNLLSITYKTTDCLLESRFLKIISNELLIITYGQSSLLKHLQCHSSCAPCFNIRPRKIIICFWSVVPTVLKLFISILCARGANHVGRDVTVRNRVLGDIVAENL